MGIDLVQGVLVPEELILSEVHIISLHVEFISLLCCEVLTITPRMVPMMIFKYIFSFLIYLESISVSIVVMNKLFKIAAFIAAF